MLDASQEYYNLGMLVVGPNNVFFLLKFHQFLTQQNLQGPLQRNFLSNPIFFLNIITSCSHIHSQLLGKQSNIITSPCQISMRAETCSCKVLLLRGIVCLKGVFHSCEVVPCGIITIIKFTKVAPSYKSSLPKFNT